MGYGYRATKYAGRMAYRGAKKLGKYTYHKARKYRSSRLAAGRNRARKPKGYRATVPGIGPTVKYVNFKTCGVLTFTTDSSAGVTEATFIEPNNLIDPFGGGGIKKPLGFDEQMAFYEHYKVLAYTYKVTFFNETTARLVVGLMPDSSLVAIADAVGWTSWCMFPRAIHRNLGKEDTSGQRTSAYLKKRVSIRAIHRERLDEAFAGTATTAPATITALHMMVTGQTEGSNFANSTVVARATVELMCFTKLYDRINLADS